MYFTDSPDVGQHPGLPLSHQLWPPQLLRARDIRRCPKGSAALLRAVPWFQPLLRPPEVRIPVGDVNICPVPITLLMCVTAERMVEKGEM